DHEPDEVADPGPHRDAAARAGVAAGELAPRRTDQPVLEPDEDDDQEETRGVLRPVAPEPAACEERDEREDAREDAEEAHQLDRARAGVRSAGRGPGARLRAQAQPEPEPGRGRDDVEEDGEAVDHEERGERVRGWPNDTPTGPHGQNPWTRLRVRT